MSRMRRVTGVLSVALALGACGGDEGLPPVEWSGTPGTPVPARLDQWVPSVDVTLDGDPHHVLIDTGAPRTLLDSGAFGGVAPGPYDVDLTLGDLQFPALEVAIYDVFGAQSREPPLDGLLGADVFEQFALTVDYLGETVTLGESPADTDGATVLDVSVAGGGGFPIPGSGNALDVDATRVILHADAEGHDVWVLVDTGASATVASGDLMALLGDAGRPRLEGVTVGTATGIASAYFTRVGSLRLGGDAGAALTSLPVIVLEDDALFDSIRAEVGEPVQAIVGGTALRWFDTTIDYPTERLVLRRYADPSHIDPDEFVAVGFTVAGGAGNWHIDDVIPGSDAAAEGLQPGEPLETIDGTDVNAFSREAIDDLLLEFGLGDEVPVGVFRSGEVVTLDIRVEDLLPDFEGP